MAKQKEIRIFDINFSQNWNNGKLDNTCFPVLRPHNPRYFKAGRLYRVHLKGEPKKMAVCSRLETLKLENITEYHAALDTGYDRSTSITLYKKMYKNSPEKCQDDSLFDFMLFKTIEILK